MDKDHIAACHCKTSHPELFLYKSDGSKLSFRSDDLKDTIEYVDVEDECEDALRWKDIPPNSKDYIWPMYCPIYSWIRKKRVRPFHSSEAIYSLLVDGWRVLKPGGKLMISIKTNFDTEAPEVLLENLKEISAVNGNNPWIFEVSTIKSIPFLVHDERRPTFTHYIVLTKPLSGGRRRKTLRSKRTRKCNSQFSNTLNRRRSLQEL